MRYIADELFAHVLKFCHVLVLPQEKIVIVAQIIDIPLNLVRHLIETLGQLSQLPGFDISIRPDGEIILCNFLGDHTNILYGFYNFLATR